MSNHTLPTVDLAQLSPDDFNDTELDLPYYLAHFKQFAEAVLMEGPDRGFINISVWRRPKDNKPYNARIMENCLSLAYFYCTDRPWNPYYNHPATRERLEAALNFWCNMQNDDGRFSEYGPQKWNLAATAFATKFMGQGLQLLHNGPPIDEDLHKRVIAADRKALYATFEDDSFQQHGRSFTNQYANAWSGALAFLNLYEDTELKALFDRRLQESMTQFQSPVGYFYEKDGPDWGYFLHTHHTDIHAAWHYAHDTEYAQYFIEKENRWYDWFSYNAIPEPNGSGYTLNRAIETRQQRTFLEEERVFDARPEDRKAGFVYTTALGTHVEMARAYGRSQSDHAQDIENARKRLESTWPNIPALEAGEFWNYSPYAFLHRGHIEWYPTTEQKEASRAKLPLIAQSRFIHQRTDSRHPVCFTYIRRPNYYAAFNAGKVLSPQQRYGIGLLYHPQSGALIQSQTGTDDAAWGTTANDTLYESQAVEATFKINGNPINPTPGKRDLPNGDLEATYLLGELGRKTVTFSESDITVTIQHKGAFTETIPLLANLEETDTLTREGDRMILTRENSTLTIEGEGITDLSIEDTEHTSGPRIVIAIQLSAEDTLTYSLKVS